MVYTPLGTYSGVVQDQRGRAVGSATVEVRLPDTVTKATLYSTLDPNSTAATNPVTCDTYGRYTFIAKPGRYDLYVSRTGYTAHTIADVQVVAQNTLSWLPYEQHTATGNISETATMILASNSTASDIELTLPDVAYSPGKMFVILFTTMTSSGKVVIKEPYETADSLFILETAQASITMDHAGAYLVLINRSTGAHAEYQVIGGHTDAGEFW